MGLRHLTGKDDMDAPSKADCKGEPSRVAPVIDRNRCEAKATCVEVCPYGVFEIQALAPSDRAALSWRGKVKAWAHGYRQAYVVRPADCHACQACVKACPEDAIHLVALARG